MFPLLIFICASLSFAAENTGKLYVFSKRINDKIFLDQVEVGKANIWIESIPEGECKVTVVGEDGKTVFEQKVTVKANETTTVVVGEKMSATAQSQQLEDLTPTFSIGVGYNSFIVSGTGINTGTLVGWTSAPSLFFVEVNKNISKTVEITLGVGGGGGRYKNSNNFDTNVSIIPVMLGLRYVWETNSWFKRAYVGGGLNATSWSAPDLSKNISSKTGYQACLGGYVPLGIMGFLQAELSYLSGGGADGASTYNVNGFYGKLAWAF